MEKIFPLWGPYGKKYMGISRIAEHSFAKGVRFDFTAVPAIFGGDIKIPNATLPSGCHPWRCSPDYSFYTYRFDLEWKDTVYAETSYVSLGSDSVLVRTEFVNNSPVIQNCLVNFFSSAEFPSSEYASLSLPEKCEFKKALDYDSYSYAVRRPWDEQNPDGFKKGEFKDSRFTFGTGLGDRAPKWHVPHMYLPPFGMTKGDRLNITIDCEHDYENAVLAVRYKTSDIKYIPDKIINGVEAAESGREAVFTLNGERTLTLEAADEPKIKFIEIGEVKRGEYKLSLVGQGASGAELDFFAITEKSEKDKLFVKMRPYDFMPDICDEDCGNGRKYTLRYNDIAGKYILRTFDENTRSRRIETGALEDCMTARLSNSDPSFDNVTDTFTGSFSRKHSDEGFFHNALVHTVFINPGESKTVFAVISNGEPEYKTPEEYEKIYLEKLSEYDRVTLSPDGKKYELSCEIFKSTLLTNAVYPIYKHGEYIIHHTPGKRWDCLYTWDSGFIGLGMNELSEDFAYYSLDTYLSDENNPDYAFLHHGSPVPVQIYLYLEMLKKQNDKTRLLSLYPRVKLYYDFMSGKIRHSTTAKLKSGLTTTYDYFYSSSGMDDYPAQVAMMERNIRGTTAPAISSSQVIRCAKILKEVALKLGKTDDVSSYDSDIKRLSRALNTYAWDDESGYYGYVLHDEEYNPVSVMRTDGGENLNKGLDGIYPLIAGVCDENQKEKIMSHLKNQNEMLSPYGISAVDMSASYFTVNGYWNGNVWFPHQWFIWKTMLDMGDGDFAYEIAKRALDIWKREVDYSYYTFEMVSVVTGRGGWFHNFGGLSSPILIWANAYFKPGTLTTGFDAWVDSVNFTDENKKLKAEFTYFGENKSFTVLAVMNPDESCRYTVKLDGREIPFRERFKGAIEADITVNDKEIHDLDIRC